MKPLISAFCDGEAGSAEVAQLREHLRACASCRATLRTYRAAPAAAAALAPVLPLHRSLLERAHDALAEAAARFGGGRGAEATLSQGVSGGSATGMGAAALAKVTALCIGTAGGAAACVATGLVPAPLDLGETRARPAAIERQVDAPVQRPTAVEYEPEPTPAPAAEPKSDEPPAPAQASPEAAPAAAEPAAEVTEPAASSGAVESAPPPAPEPAPVAEPAPVESGEGGDPAGEFGP
jgi:Putative zinc-finger